ncbi:MAG: hypothetical protein ACLRSW_07965 [Christensenellaceae bacterium]
MDQSCYQLALADLKTLVALTERNAVLSRGNDLWASLGFFIAVVRIYGALLLVGEVFRRFRALSRPSACENRAGAAIIIGAART